MEPGRIPKIVPSAVPRTIGPNDIFRSVQDGIRLPTFDVLTSRSSPCSRLR